MRLFFFSLILRGGQSKQLALLQLRNYGTRAKYTKLYNVMRELYISVARFNETTASPPPPYQLHGETGGKLFHKGTTRGFVSRPEVALASPTPPPTPPRWREHAGDI